MDPAASVATMRLTMNARKAASPYQSLFVLQDSGRAEQELQVTTKKLLLLDGFGYHQRERFFDTFSGTYGLEDEVVQFFITAHSNQ